jgi:hypothetical protein
MTLVLLPSVVLIQALVKALVQALVPRAVQPPTPFPLS